MSDYFPDPSQVEVPFPLNEPAVPAGQGSAPVEAHPYSQEAMAESETRIAEGATPYAIIDETAEEKGVQMQAKQNPPFDDPSIFKGAIPPPK